MIDANALMAAAKERTGLSDWGDDWYLEPMHWLVDAINTESELTEFGAGALPEMLIAHLVNQLEVHDWYKRPRSTSRRSSSRCSASACPARAAPRSAT